jgi:hypothetical protein
MTKDRARANRPAMSRRTLCIALPAAGLVAPAAASPQAPDPMVILYREWLDVRRTVRDLMNLPGNEEWDDPRILAAQDREDAIEREMLETRPTSIEGIAALAALAWVYVHPGLTDPEEFVHFAQSRDCQAVIALWKACTGLDGYPMT